MDFSRRGFLKLFGATAGVAVLQPERVSLFGAGEEQKAVPSIMGFHSVVLRNLTLGKADPASQKYVCPRTRTTLTDRVGPIETVLIMDGAVPVGRVLPQFPKNTRKSLFGVPSIVTLPSEWEARERVSTQDPTFGEDEIVVPVPQGTDLHLGFYRASEIARETFYQRSLKILTDVPKHYRPAMQLVTVVHNPIYMRPAAGYDSAGKWDNTFEVVCDCETRCVMDPDLEGWDLYSQFGEVPIDTPTDIDFAVLLKCDREIVSRSGPAWDRYQSFLG